MISEYLFHPTGVDVSGVKYEMMGYVQKHNLSYPIYTNDQGIQWYFENDYWHQDKWTHGFEDNEMGDFTREVTGLIDQERGTIILLRWPPLPDNSPAYQVIKKCNIGKIFSDRNVIIGEVYTC